MSMAATLALNNGGAGVRSERYQADYGRRYPTGRGMPALNPSSNTPPEREGGVRRQSPADRRPEAPEMDWPALVRRCLDGDTGAWTELVVAQQRRVYALCYRFTASSHDAEDLTQDVFIKLYANLRSFDSAKGSFQTWITTLTRNLLVDHFRRSRQQRATDSIDAGWDQGNDAPPAEPLVDRRTTPLQHAVESAAAHGAERPGQGVAGAARSSYSARSAGYGLQRDCGGFGNSTGNCQVSYQPWPGGTSTAAGTY
jgi:RNA polymerase sigma factor (sigma-70 family)